MGCCGQNRAAFANHATQPSFSLPSNPPTSLRFVQGRSIVVRGPLTGRRYEFDGRSYTQGIDPRDVTALLKSGHFEKAPE
jgi:hypothetical protein